MRFAVMAQEEMMGLSLHMKVCLSCTSRVLYPLLQYILGLLNELPVQINRIAVYPPDGIVFSEYIV